MIVYNGKKLDTSHKEDAFVRNYVDQIKFLRGFKKKYFVFTLPDKKIRIDEDGNIHTGNGSWIPFREQFSTYKDGVYDVRYYQSSFFHPKTGHEEFRPRKLDFRGTMVLNMESQEDLIWFLIFVSPHFEKPDWFDVPKDKPHLELNRIRKPTYFKLENKVRQAEKEYDFMADVQRAMSAIYDDVKGLVGEQLIYVAKSYNVVTEDIPDRAIRQELGRKVLKLNQGKYDAKLIKEFLESIPVGNNTVAVPESVVAQAVVNDLVELGMIKSVPKGTKMVWVTDSGTELIRFTPTQNANDVIVEYLTKNPEVRAGMEEDVKKRREDKKESQTE